MRRNPGRSRPADRHGLCGFQGLLGPVRGQPVCRTCQRGGELTQISRWRTDVTGELAKTPVRRRDRRVRSGEDQGQVIVPEIYEW